MTSRGDWAGSGVRPGRTRSGRGGDSSPWQAQRLPVFLLVGGAALALVIGTVVAQSGAQQPPRSPAPSAAGRTATASVTSHGGRSHSTSPPADPSQSSSASTQQVGASKPCAPSDLTITTSTDRSSYSPGVSITVTTRLVSSVACEFTLFPAGIYNCGESIVVDTWSGEQVFPTLGQSEQCASLPEGVLTPGSAETATIVWNQRTLLPTGGTGQASPGRYEAIGSWSWGSGAEGAPYEVAADSAPFTILA